MKHGKMAYSVRDFKEEDYPALVDLWKSTGLWMEERGDTLEVVKRTIEKGGKLLVLTEGDEIIGSSWLTTDGRRLFIQYFSIAPKHQGKGLSHILLRESLLYASSLGLQVKLEVHRSNTVARNLYMKWGFKPLGDYHILILRDPKVESIFSTSKSEM